MKYKCFLCKKLRNHNQIELKEVRKGLLVYVCMNHWGEDEEEQGQNIIEKIRMEVKGNVD